MAQAVLQKRTADVRTFDINCSNLLGATETITSVSSIAADQGGLTFGLPTVNTVEVSYPDGSIGPVGQVVQVQISGGAIPSGRVSLLCMVRSELITTINPCVEATVGLSLINNPPF